MDKYSYYIYIACFIVGFIIGFTCFLVTKGKLKNLENYISIVKNIKENIEKTESDFAPLTRLIGLSAIEKDSVNENKENTVVSNVIKFENDNKIKQLSNEELRNIIQEEVAFSKMQSKYKNK